MENVKQSILSYLDRHECSYNEIHHKPAGSAEEYHNELGTRYEQQAKALLIRYKKSGEKGFVVTALPAQKKCDLQKVKLLLGAKEVRLANLSQLKDETGCNYGELPPFAKPFGMRLIMDKELLNEQLIFFNCGELSYSLSLDPDKLQLIENPIMM